MCELELSSDISPRLSRIIWAREQQKTPGDTGGYGMTRGPRRSAGIALRDLEVFRRGLAAVGDELVLDHLTLVQAAQTRPLDSRDMDEHVLIACRRTDETVALSRVEPFDGALLHRLSPSQ